MPSIIVTGSAGSDSKDVLGANIHIDPIFPAARFFDNEFANKERFESILSIEFTNFHVFLMSGSSTKLLSSENEIVFQSRNGHIVVVSIWLLRI